MKNIAPSIGIVLGLLLLVGCTSFGVIDNTPQAAQSSSESSYSLKTGGVRGAGDVSFILAFSGGGTRAAALAYGILEELRDTTVVIDGRPPSRLLDEVDIISSVSGGSFTAAYYGVFGDRIFEDFPEVFLRRNVESQLIKGLFNPLQWFQSTGRTEMAVQLYAESVFEGATFADMQRQSGPLVVINASDLGYGVRFSFIQEYFNLLCSDIASFPVARAVAASSAVPVLFNPVVLQNYFDCKSTKPAWLAAAQQRAADNPELLEAVAGLQTYYNKDRRKYAHFVDGGITDNLGLRAIYDIVEIAGGPAAFLTAYGRKTPRRLVIISVDASTDPEPGMDLSNRQPSVSEALGAVTDVQLHRYNNATLELMAQSVKQWSQEVSTPERPVTPYFIQTGFSDISDPDKQQFLNNIPTSFTLSDEQVDVLIDTGQGLLRNNPDFQQLLKDLSGVDPD